MKVAHKNLKTFSSQNTVSFVYENKKRFNYAHCFFLNQLRNYSQYYVMLLPCIKYCSCFV